jgi:hypothetical protein
LEPADDEYAGEFWEMIEAGPDASQGPFKITIPGSWNEEEDA